MFLQLADGIDDATWLYHLRPRHYSRWLRESIKDGRLAAEAEQIEQRTDLSAWESRTRIKAASEQYYTLPTSVTPAADGPGTPVGPKTPAPGTV